MTTFDTPTAIKTAIAIGFGDITVAADDRTTTAVNVLPKDAANPNDVQAATDVTVDLVGDVLDIRTPTAWRRFAWRDYGSITVSVELPAGSTLAAKTGFGTIRCTGSLEVADLKTSMGEVRVDHAEKLVARSGFGDVTVECVEGDAQVGTGSGKVRVGTVGGTALVRNSNGDITVGCVAHPVQLRTSHGSIHLGQAGSSVTATSSAGSVTIDEVAAGAVSVKTAAGSVDIGVREGTSAWLDLTSRFGSVRNGLDAASAPDNAESTVQIRAKTAAGDITISRARLAEGRP